MNRFRAFLLSLCFCLAAVFLFTVISVHPEHECHGADCPVCLLIQRTEFFFRQLRCAVFHAAFPVVALLMMALVLNRVFFFFIPLSAVRLKVKINR
ncbi:MAG: hypothetical protein LBP80_00810 [Treponema sp.]|nr:hypothetical protein [Treponema sp.]